MRALRGTLTEPGQNSPYRDRSIEENLALLRGMRDGKYQDGEHVLRARIDMASPNINLRDPAIYRIKHAEHHRTGGKWCVYPMYTYAHPIEDALENITHSICTLEFEDQRPFYDWLLRTLIPLLHPQGFDKYLGELARWLMHDFDERLPVFRREADKLGLEGINAPLNEAAGGSQDEAISAVAEAMSRLRQLPEPAYRLGLHLVHAADSGYRYTPDYIGVPRQIEFARLNLTYVALSKRKLIQLVQEKHVEGWDDPRMPTLVGARRRGYTPQGFRLLAERVGVSKANSWIDYSTLEDCMRDDLNEHAPRRIAVLDPLKLIIDNYPEGEEELCQLPNHPQKPDWGKRDVPFSRELWIEREDFAEVPPPKYFRLYPPGMNSAGEPVAGNKVRLRYGFVIECTGCEKDVQGNVTAVHCSYYADSKSGTPGSDNYKVKGNIHWVSAKHAYATEVRLYDRLFKDPHPGAGDRDFLEDLNPDSVKTIKAQLEPALREARAGEHYQFERHGYFVPDRIDPISGAPEFNRAVTLKDSWQK
jgi:glutaminyl-tRNA synthetase